MINDIRQVRVLEALTGKLCELLDSPDKYTQMSEQARQKVEKEFNIRKLNDILKRRIKLVEHSTILSKFIKNVLFPSKILDVEEKEKDVFIYININQKKTINAKNLNMLRFATKRYFDINNIYLKIKK